MRRGLKLGNESNVVPVSVRRARFRTYAPMRRGLKREAAAQGCSWPPCPDLCPDEKGIETLGWSVYANSIQTSPDLCPDEKGIETYFFITSNPALRKSGPMPR